MSEAQQPQDSADQMRTVLTVIGVALMGSVGVYVGIAWIMSKGAGRANTGELWQTLQYPLMAVAVVAAIVARAIEPKLRSLSSLGARAGGRAGDPGSWLPPKAAAGPNSRYQVAFLVPMALFESIAIYGLVLFFLGMPFNTFLYWAGVALGLQLGVGMPKIGVYVEEARREVSEFGDRQDASKE